MHMFGRCVLETSIYRSLITAEGRVNAGLKLIFPLRYGASLPCSLLLQGGIRVTQ